LREVGLPEWRAAAYNRAMVGVADESPMSPYGYKPKSGRGWSTSGHAPITDIAAARSAFAVIGSGSRFKAEVPTGSAQGRF